MAGNLLVAILLLSPALARAETPAEAFAKGKTLLAKGDFATALEAFTAAARGDRENVDYLQHYAMLRRVVELRSRLESEQDPQRREYTARALRAFYVNQRIYPELLKLDQEVHARLGSADSAANLAETQLTLNQPAEAATTLSTLDSSKSTAMTRAVLGIALARSGKADEARQLAEKLALPADAGPNLTYAAARLHAGTGDSATALKLLKACFEATLPSMLDGFKAHAKSCPEFAAIASSPEFAQVLKTESQVPESKCSGGRSCAGCPMSGKCPKSQAEQ
jgi:thioredoxin-like negative regulator of GroEL